ncbi:outer membrane channel protein TolC [Celerinatantimonas sp. YJH-8]|uniref:outer membrane channel protein TolC n=1 Tax=Celerinatantimonas sp. YJH-8 TaxID=3228714 RepID=UPI0038CB8F56
MNFKLKPILVVAGLGTFSLNSYADDLIQIYQLAQQKDPVILQYKAQRDAAFEHINQSRASLLPHIDLTAGYNYATGNHSADNSTNHYDSYLRYNQASAGVSLTQSIFSKANWVNLTITEKSATQQDALYKYQQQNLMVRVSTAYFNVLRAIDDLSYVRANKAAVKRQLDQTKQRFDVGLTPITDVHEAQAEYDRTIAEEITAENTLDNSYEALRQIIGISPRDLKLLDTTRFDPTPVKQGTKFWMDTATDKNLQLNAQRIAKEVANEEIGLAKSGHLPTLSLSAGLQTQDTHFRDYTPPSYQQGHYDTGSIGLNFALPLYQGGETVSQVREARFNYVQASQSLEETYRTVQTNLNSSYNNVHSNISSIKAYEQAVVSSQSALEATEAGFTVGTRTIVDVQDATRNLYQAKEQLAGARYDYIINMLTLKQLAGTLTMADLNGINDVLYQPKEQVPTQPAAPSINDAAKAPKK